MLYLDTQTSIHFWISQIDEYNQLEDQLRSALVDIDKRERQLAANESEVVRLRQDLQREHDHQLTELKEASRRMKEDCVHQVQIEKWVIL